MWRRAIRCADGIGDFGASVVLIALLVLALVLFTGVTLRRAAAAVAGGASDLWHALVPEYEEEEADDDGPVLALADPVSAVLALEPDGPPEPVPIAAESERRPGRRRATRTPTGRRLTKARGATDRARAYRQPSRARPR